MQLYSCVVMACATNLDTIRINTDFYIILGQKYGLPFQNCGMYVVTSGGTASTQQSAGDNTRRSLRCSQTAHISSLGKEPSDVSEPNCIQSVVTTEDIGSFRQSA